jgi:hypothetical protein
VKATLILSLIPFRVLGLLLLNSLLSPLSALFESSKTGSTLLKVRDFQEQITRENLVLGFLLLKVEEEPGLPLFSSSRQ